MRDPIKPSVTGTTFDTQRTIDGGRFLVTRRRWSPRAPADSSPQEPRAKDVEDPREVFDKRGARQDEDEAQNQRDDDAGQQDLLLVLPGHAEGREDDDEHEQVVNTQRFFGDVAAQVLLTVLRSPTLPTR